MDCNVIKDDYTHIAVHKLNQNYVEKLKFDWNCFGGSKTFLYPPEKLLVCVWEGSKTWKWQIPWNVN